MDSFEEKFISRETALHFNIFFGTRAVEKNKTLCEYAYAIGASL